MSNRRCSDSNRCYRSSLSISGHRQSARIRRCPPCRIPALVTSKRLCLTNLHSIIIVFNRSCHNTTRRCHRINRKVLCLESDFLYSRILYVLLTDGLKLQLACLSLCCIFCAQLGLAGIVYCYDLNLIGSLGHFLDRSTGEGYVYIAALGPAVAEFLPIIKEIDIVC